MDGTVDLDTIALEAGLTALEAARSWSPRVVSRLESHIRTADDLGLFRINPLRFAAEHSMADAEAVDLFLYAAHEGLFRMEWNLVCASCGNTARSFRGLAKVDSHFTCDMCQMVNDPSLDEYVQVAFTIAPRIRTITYHEPDSLSAEDRLFNYQVSHDIRPGSGQLTSIQSLRSSTHLVADVEPGSSISADFEFRGQALAIRAPLQDASVVYFPAASGGGESGSSAVSVMLADGRLDDIDRPLEPLEYTISEPIEMRLLFPGASSIPNGPVSATVTNRMGERAPVWIVEYPEVPRFHAPIEFGPVLTAKRLLSTQTFRTLFRSETVAASESLEIRDLTFLFTDLRDSTAMYERIGDASAYNLVRLHFDALEVVIREHGGAIVKTIGDAIMATFVEPAEGVRTALGMRQRLDAFNRTSSSDLVLKMGLHRGHVLAVSSSDSVDYFGQTVNIAARVQATAGAGQICMTEDVYRAAGVADVLDGVQMERDSPLMKGVSEPIPIYRFTPR